ncbi:Txe/YoeB family addiction module toxin [Mucilaginibacter conchicola]|uniref:Putative mRNA interferase YoeB n=1 Tax=Mucilaginibacter conchicola TaxID=2303333 RepID=A0A372NTM4_9SPHI|nr:Txe/YoeB family addiction module toxin [Mucilaginibacter conchicola]RFZ92019.1 Txe/YoeB family addiction module toxin [Mucilaginibacter conchicola]
MEVIFTSAALAHLQEWRKSGNAGVQKKISELIASIKETPFEGVGKPEPLKHQLTGKWSRRINHEHRIVYSFDNDIISIYSLKGHY